MTAQTNTPPRTFRRLLGSICTLLQTRFELIGLEIAQAKGRLLTLILLGFATLLLSSIALVTLTALIAALFWDTYRWQALTLLTAVYVWLALLCLLKLRTAIRSAPLVFESTLAELKKDSEFFKKTSSAETDE
jgi:uncharacterized membrane protein YqjE